jgi:predicted Zn-dependent protease
MRLRRGRQVGIALTAILLLGGLAVWWRFQTDPRRLFLRADSLLKAGRYHEAEVALAHLARLRPPSPVDRVLCARVKLGLDHPDLALAELAPIPDEHPIAPLARLMTGQIEIRQGRAGRAEAALLTSLKLLPRGIQPRKELVYIYNVQHRQAELDAQLAGLLDLDALDFQYVLHWTKTRNTVWNPRGDLAALEKFVASDPSDRWSRLALVEALRRLDRLDEAEAVLRKLPLDDPEARASHVLLLMSRGDLATAESLLAEGPGNHAELARLRGQLALRRHDGPAAVREFRIAHCCDPLDHMTTLSLGTALCMARQTEAAKPYLEAARRHEQLWALVSRAATPEGEHDPTLPHLIGVACAAIGRVQEARAWLRLALKRDPLDAAGQQMLFELEHGARSRSAQKRGPAADSPSRQPATPDRPSQPLGM